MARRVVDFRRILEYASQFPEMRMIDSRPVDVSRVSRSGTLDGPVSAFGGIRPGDRIDGSWEITGMAIRGDEVDVDCRGPDGITVTFMLADPAGSPGFPFDIAAARIGYRDTGLSFEAIRPAGMAFATFAGARLGPDPRNDWPAMLSKARPAGPDPHVVEIRPDGKVYVRMTPACQERCVFCFFYDTPQEADLESVTDVDDVLESSLEQIDPGATTQMILTGGEPTLVPGFERIVQRLLDRGFKNIVVQTNGILPARLGLLDRFSAYSDRLSFGFSLHAATRETSNRVTGTASTDFFPDKLASIRQAVRCGFMTKITCVLTTFNLAELSDIVRFCLTLRETGRPDNVVLQFSMPAIKGLLTSNRDACPTLAGVRNAVGPALDLADANGLRASFSSLCSVPPCTIPDHIRHLETTWYRKGSAAWWETERAFGSRCGGCLLKTWCSGVSPAYLEWFGDGELVPFCAATTEIRVPD